MKTLFNKNLFSNNNRNRIFLKINHIKKKKKQTLVESNIFKSYKMYLCRQMLINQLLLYNTKITYMINCHS